jgi:hypothetical protein
MTLICSPPAKILATKGGNSGMNRAIRENIGAIRFEKSL